MTPQAPTDTFDQNANGWKVVTYPGSPNAQDPQWSTGQISFAPTTDRQDQYFSAPAPYLGNQLFASSGKIQFTLGATPTPNTLSTEPLVWLTGGGTTLAWSWPANSPAPQSNQSVEITLAEGNGWQAWPEKTPATVAQIREVLNNVEQLLVRGVWGTTTSTDASQSPPATTHTNPTNVSLGQVALVYHPANALLANVPMTRAKRW